MPASTAPAPDAFLNHAELACLRTWYAGMSARQAVERYLPNQVGDGQSSRAAITRLRSRVAEFARRRHREDLAQLLDHPAAERAERAKAVLDALVNLPLLPDPTPVLADDVSLWVSSRAALALKAAGLHTLADIAPLVAQRRRWWVTIPRLGHASAKQLEACLADMPELMAHARELVTYRPSTGVVPWERLQVPIVLDGSEGALRAPRQGCTLNANTDIEAINAWLAIHEAPTTARAYRKEAERLVLWALMERGKPLSSLKNEDAVAYRSFLRAPTPVSRWIGTARPRSAPDWRPFQAGLSPRSAGYAITVVNALFRWLVEQRYLLANPFAGVKVKGAAVASDVDGSRALTKFEWTLVRIEADKTEFQFSWAPESAARLRFLLDFWLATGLRPSEMVGARLGNIERQPGGDNWLHVRGKGDKPGRVGLPSLAINALERYLRLRHLPVSSNLWRPETPLVPNLTEEGTLTTSRMWALLKRFFLQAADSLQDVNPSLSDKLRRMTPHWLRHTHATIALESGVDLRSVRDNLRHASIATTTGYLNPDDQARARQLRDAFPG